MAWPVRVGIALAALLVLALGVAWFLHTHERIEETVPLPPRGEAAYNPVYALRQALRADGLDAQSRRRLQLDVSPLAPRDTLLLLGDPRTASAREVDALLDWVAGGGHLLVRTPPRQRRAGAPRPHGLLARLGVRPVDGAVRCEPLQVPGESPHVEFCRGQRFALVAHAPELAWGLADAPVDPGEPDQVRAIRERIETRREHLAGPRGVGLVHARLVLGEGRVDVLADFDFLDNGALHERPHFLLARQLLAPNWGRGTMHLVYAASVPPLWMVILRQGWMAWGPLLLALVAWLWMRTQRLGPLLPSPPASRRALLEHVRASGEHLVRYGRAPVLHEAVRAAFFDRLRRRDPLAASLDGEAGIEAIAARTGLAPGDVRQALQAPGPDDAAGFRQRIARLIEMRRRL